MTSFFRYILRADSKEEMEKWVAVLKPRIGCSRKSLMCEAKTRRADSLQQMKFLREELERLYLLNSKHEETQTGMSQKMETLAEENTHLRELNEQLAIINNELKMTSDEIRERAVELENRNGSLECELKLHQNEMQVIFFCSEPVSHEKA